MQVRIAKINITFSNYLRMYRCNIVSGIRSNRTVRDSQASLDRVVIVPSLVSIQNPKLFIIQPSAFILSIKWNFVRGSFVRSFVRWCPPFLFVLYYCAVLLYMCGCAVNKTPGGPRAQEGTRATGTTRGTHPRAPQGRALRC